MGLLDYIKKRKNEAEEKCAADGRREIEEKEERYRKELENSPIIDALFEEFEKHPWMLRCQSDEEKGIIDGCMRTLSILKDAVEIKWSGYTKKSRTEMLLGHAAFSFTQIGYTPKHDLIKEKVLLEVVAKRFKSQIPHITFASDYHYGDNFTTIYTYYHLPRTNLKRD